MLVFDASPLIVLGTADRLSVLEHYDRTLVIPEPVREEVVEEGLQAGYPDARRLNEAIERELLHVRPVETGPRFQELAAIDGLSSADAAVLAYADANDGIAVMDESRGRAVAEVEGIRSRGTAWIVLSRVAHDDIAPEQGREIIDALIDAGWYCSTDLYRRILAKLETL